MARARQGQPPTPGLPELPPEKGLMLVEQLMTKARQLLGTRPLSSDAHSQWVLLADNYLSKAFGANSPNVTAVTTAGLYGAFPMNADEQYWEKHRADTLTTQISKLEGLAELLRTNIQLSQGTAPSVRAEPAGTSVFLVHGHDEALLHETARLLTNLELPTIILREQPNQGRTIIEKFEDYADVGFAVVQLTPDDRGGASQSPFEEQQPRARQNVVLELGYFLGRLGRNRVCALYRRGVEIPSDYTGVAYVELDDRGAWRWELAKELKAAGFSVDLNRVG